MTDPACREDAPATMPDLLLLTLVTGCFVLQPISTDLYLASLPHLVRVFQSTPAAVQLTLSLFALGFGFAQLIAGPVSDRFGRRPALLGGLLVYVLGSLGCALAQGLTMLIICRVIQAVGCCTAVVVSRAVVRDCHALAAGAQRIARASSNMGIAVLLGPIIGAQFQIYLGWRAAFVLHVLLGLLLLAFVWMRQTETNRQPDPLALAGPTLGRNYLAVAATRDFWIYALPGCLSYGALFVFISGASFSLIKVLGVSLAAYGYCFSLGCAGYMIGSLICRHILNKYAIVKIMDWASRLMLLATAIYTSLALLGIEHWAMFVALHFTITCGHGFIFPCTQAGSVEPFPTRAGAAAGLFGAVGVCSALMVGTVLGATLGENTLPIAFTLLAATSSLVISIIFLNRPAKRRTA